MKLTKTCAKFLRKHGGTILAIGASIGVAVTAIETGKATVKANTLVSMNRDEPMTKKEIVQDCWKFYIPAAVAGAGTVACILGSNALNKKQLARMTAAYMALGKTYQEYRRQVAQQIGTEEEKDIYRDTQDILKTPEASGEGETLLCYEPISKRYFHATEAELMEAFYNMNRDMTLSGEVPLNNLYSYLNLDFVPELDHYGWSVDYLGSDWEYYWIDFSYTKQQTDDGLEVYYVSAFQEPLKDYMNYDAYTIVKGD